MTDVKKAKNFVFKMKIETIDEVAEKLAKVLRSKDEEELKDLAE